MMMTKFLYRLACIAMVIMLCASVYAQDKPLKVKLLRPAALLQKDVTVPETFDGWTALRRLYAGNYYKDTSRQLISWSCPACDSQAYLDINDDLSESVFPFRDGVSTRLIKVYSVEDSSGEYRYVAFNHSYFDEEGFQTGRTTGGVLGLAKFVKRGDAWALRSITPAVGGYGAFQQCPTPHLLEIGDNQYAFFLTHINGGAGGPYTGDMLLIAGVGGRYRQVMQAVGTARVGDDSTNAWASQLTALPGKKTFRDLSVTTKGEYSVNEYEDGPPRGFTNKEFSGGRHCSFTITSRYTYADGKGYQQTGKPVVVIKAK